jgi:hypothetical protein
VSQQADVDVLEAATFYLSRGVVPVAYAVSVRIGMRVVQVESAGVVRRFVWQGARFNPLSKLHRKLAIDRFEALAAADPLPEDDPLEQLNRELLSVKRNRKRPDDRQLPAGDRA